MITMKPEVSTTGWKDLCQVGGMAAILAGILFRRNLGAEVALLSNQKQPTDVAGWFLLLQTHRLLGLTYLNIFDLANYALVGLVFLALYAIFRQGQKSLATVAAGAGFAGILIYLASNTALSLLALSDQFALTANDAQHTQLLAAGQALLALNRFSSAGAHPGSGGYASLLLVALAGMLWSIAMLRSNLFGRPVAYVGMAASGLDLTYCLAYPLVASSGASVLAVLFIPVAGLLVMVWHILVGWKLLRPEILLEMTPSRKHRFSEPRSFLQAVSPSFQ
jgi:hypothetical protein